MKKDLFFVLVLVILSVSCSKDDEVILPKLTANNESVVTYFKEVALGFEFGDASGITRRWAGKMKIFIGGQITPDLLEETNNIVNEINDLSTTDFMIELVSDSIESNFYIFFGAGDSYTQMFPLLADLVKSNWGLFSIFWNSSQELFRGYMYVDVFRANLIEQKHLLREELTQSLGLAKDSDLYFDSIFRQSYSTTTEFSKIDRDLIRLLYHSEMKIGLNRNEVDEVLRSILVEEQ